MMELCTLYTVYIVDLRQWLWSTHVSFEHLVQSYVDSSKPLDVDQTYHYINFECTESISLNRRIFVSFL